MATLSDHEKRQFYILEQRLKIDDPKFVKSMRSASKWHRSRIFLYRYKSQKLIFGTIGTVLGIVLFCIGNALSPNPTAIPFEIAGLSLLLVGLDFVLKSTVFNDEISRPKAKSKKSFISNLESKWMANFEARWDERKRNGF